MSKIRLVSLGILLQVVLSSIAWGVEVNSYLFEGIVAISNSIEKLCPSDECVVIGLGRSPTPLIAYLQLKRLEKKEKLEYAWNLPLSSFRHGSGGRPKLEGAYLEKLTQHFNIYFPNADELAGRRILLVDYGATGESLVGAALHLQDYLSARSKITKEALPALDVVGICNQDNFPLGKHPQILNWILVDESATANQLFNLDQKTVGARFVGGDFDDLSEFGSFDVTKTLVPIVKPRSQEKYLSHQGDIEVRMKKPELSADKLGLLAKDIKIGYRRIEAFDAEKWLTPKTQEEWLLLASQIRFGTVEEQQKFYSTALTQTQFEFVTEILDYLSSYRGVSPSRLEIFQSALVSKNRDIRDAAKRLFYGLGSNLARESIETSTYLELFPTALEAGLLNEVTLTKAYGEFYEISREAFIIVGFTPVLKSSNERLIERVMELLKSYKLYTDSSFKTDPVAIVREIKPVRRLDHIEASKSGKEIVEEEGIPLYDLLEKELNVKIWSM